MTRLFVSDENVVENGGSITIHGSEVHHIINVLRKKKGDLLNFFDGRGCEYKARIISIRKEKEPAVETIVLEKLKTAKEPEVRIRLFQCIPKGDKMDLLVQKCTEIGIHEIVPVVSERTIVRPSGGRFETKIERWRKIARSASEQSGRNTIPAVRNPEEFKNAIKNAERDCSKLMLWESETGKHLGEYLRKIKTDLKEVILMVGPEGGFSPAEAAEAGECGFNSVTMGSRVLRTETAGLIAAAIILYETGEIG